MDKRTQKTHAVKMQGDGEPLPRHLMEVRGDPDRDLRRLGALASLGGQLVAVFPPAYRNNGHIPGAEPTTAHMKSWPEGDPEYDGSHRDIAEDYPRMGWEAEYHGVDPDGSAHVFTDAEQTAFQERASGQGYNVGEELMKFTREIDPKEPIRTLEALEKSRYDLLRFVAEQEGEESLIYPGSTLPGVDRDERYLSSDPHVRRIIDNVVGSERVLKFDSVSAQLTIEVPSPLHGARAAIQTVPAMTAIGILGESSPASGPEYYVNATDELIDDGRTDMEAARRLLETVGADRRLGYHAVRNVQREIIMGTGGVVRNIPPLEALHDQSNYLDWLAETTKTRLADRQFGDHTVRVQGHQPTGAIEQPDPDNAGYRMERLGAIQELELRITHLSMDPVLATREMQAFIRDNYADVFLPLDSDEHIKSVTAGERANRMRAAMHGKHAELTYEDGHKQEAGTTLRRVVSFLEVMGAPVSDTTKQEVERGLQTLPKGCRQPMREYYGTGVGTFSEAWHMEYTAIQVRNPGMDEQSLMRLTNASVAQEFKAYAEQKVEGGTDARTA